MPLKGNNNMRAIIIEEARFAEIILLMKAAALQILGVDPSQVRPEDERRP